jgi:hypothetical protein
MHVSHATMQSISPDIGIVVLLLGSGTRFIWYEDLIEGINTFG